MNKQFAYGLIFIMLAGIIYTIERASTKLAEYLKLSGFLAGGYTGEVPYPKTAGFFDNWFTPLFIIIGFGLFCLGWFRPKK